MMDDTSDTDRIESDLAATRARMDNRLDELQNHLTPKQMLNDVFAYFRGGDGASFTNDLIARAKANPVPVALVGIGIAWLIASGQGSHAKIGGRNPQHADLEARLRLAEGSVQRFDHDDDDTYGQRLDDARGRVVGLTRHASENAASYTQRIKDAVAAVASSVRDKSHDLTTGASDAFGRFKDGASEHGASFQEGTRTMARSSSGAFSAVATNPFALGAVAALVGLVAGALLPTSEEEEAALGSVATRIRTAGRDLAQDVVDRGGRIATDTLESVKDSAQAHGLSVDKPVSELVSEVKSGDLAANVKQVAQETLQAGKDSVQTHLGGEKQDLGQDG